MGQEVSVKYVEAAQEDGKKTHLPECGHKVNSPETSLHEFRLHQFHLREYAFRIQIKDNLVTLDPTVFTTKTACVLDTTMNTTMMNMTTFVHRPSGTIDFQPAGNLDPSINR
jgi:hypothetical protein